MANARHRIWHRAGPAATLTMGTLLVAAAASGCDDGGESTTGTTTNTTSTTTNTTSNTGGGGSGGATGGSGGTGGAGACAANVGLTKAADAPSALDSTPDSTGAHIYYTAHNASSNNEGDSGVYGVDVCNGAITTITVGGKLAGPVGITISSDDKTLYVADAAYDITDDDPDSARGAILQMGTGADSTPSVVPGTEGLRPRGVDIKPDANGDVIFFSGADPTTGEGALYSIPAGGGAATKLAGGAPFEDPSGVAAGKVRTYVTDTLASDQRFASILVVEGSAVQTYLPAVRVGYPAGIALSMDEATLFVSGIDPLTEADVVLVIDVATKTITPYTDATLAANTDAGGLHRARKTDLFSWSDLTSDSGGAVYLVKFK